MQRHAMLKTVSLLLCLVPLAATAQVGTRLAGPVSGIIFDAQARALRPMLGVPGASYLGAALAADLDAAVVSPDGERALAVSGGQLLLVTGLKSAVLAAPVDGAIAGVDRMAWSADGAYAAVYSSGGASAQVLREAGAAAGPAMPVAFAVTALAVGTDGDVAAGAADGVYLLAAGSAPRLLAPMGRVSALAVRGTSLYAADVANGSLWTIGNFASSAEAALFAEGVDSPVGVQVSADGRRLFVASADSRIVRLFDVASRTAVRQVELEVTPTELTGFGGRDLWLLNSGGSGADPLYVATGGDDAAAWFVPAGRQQ